MKNFIFQTTTTIVNEAGATSRLGEIATEMGMTRVLLVTDPGIAKVGLLDKAVTGLSNDR